MYVGTVEKQKWSLHSLNMLYIETGLFATISNTGIIVNTEKERKSIMNRSYRLKHTGAEEMHRQSMMIV